MRTGTRLLVVAVLLAGLPRAAAEAADPELGRPVYGLKVTNRTARTAIKKVPYVWTDDRGRRFKWYKDVPDGRDVTFYVQVTAVDIPKRVMGATATVVFPLAAERAPAVFPVRTLPLNAGEVRTVEVKVHLSPAEVAAEGGNWLEIVPLDDVTKNMFVRPGGVRFTDGTRAVYDDDPTLPTAAMVDVAAAEAEAAAAAAGASDVPVLKGPPTEFGFFAGKKGEHATVPITGGRVWVRPYRKKDGTYVRGHYRRRPSK
jgi:hypothetical protein